MFSLRVLPCIYFIFCQFQPGVAYKSVACNLHVICRDQNKEHFAHRPFLSITKLRRHTTSFGWHHRSGSLGSVLSSGNLTFLNAQLANKLEYWRAFFQEENTEN